MIGLITTIVIQVVGVAIIVKKFLIPTTTEQTLKSKIKKVNEEGKLVIITSHILSDLDELCSHVIYMQEGQVLINKPFYKLQSETNEIKLTKMITQLIKNNTSKSIITS